ncbi:MAG: Holliday junction resolvase RuvX [Patescibacteria group bacterium]|nr:Holliday junction resolvase RuvX [Patescibacteria group bacterium]
MKVLGIDLGKKRIGVALGDSEKKIVVGLSTIINNAKTWDSFKEIILRENIEMLVIGLPKTMSGQIGEQAVYTKKWAEKADEKLSVKIDFVDERLTSKMARDSLASLGTDLKKEDIDQAAAVLLLQSYFGS